MYITTREAANICGVTKVTIQNLVRSKAVDYIKKGQIYMVSKSDIEKYREKINKIYKAEKTIDDILAERENFIMRAENARNEAEDALKEIGIYPRRVNAMKEVLRWFLNIYKCHMTENEMYIISNFVEGRSITEIADDMGVSRQLGHTRYFNMVRNIMRIKRRDEEFEKENKELKKKVALLEKKIIEIKSDKDIEDEVSKLINQKLKDECVSVRLYNCCKVLNINTIGELAQCSRSEILKLRNMGRKTIVEIENLLDKYNLTLGMNIKDIVNNVSPYTQR